MKSFYICIISFLLQAIWFAMLGFFENINSIWNLFITIVFLIIYIKYGGSAYREGLKIGGGFFVFLGVLLIVWVGIGIVAI